MKLFTTLVVSLAGLVSASPSVRKLDLKAAAKAHQRDETAVRAYSGVHIATADGRSCLSVDRLSGDKRANLTPVQLEPCRKVRRQRWDVITAGVHNNQPGQALIVSSATQACLNVDRREPQSNRVFLYSCGGRADGSGGVTDSQLFAFSAHAGPQPLRPLNVPGSCLIAYDEELGIRPCNNETAAAKLKQSFVFQPMPRWNAKIDDIA